MSLVKALMPAVAAAACCAGVSAANAQQAPSPAQYPQPYPQQYQYVLQPVAAHEPQFHWHLEGGYSDPTGPTSAYLHGGSAFAVGVSVAPTPGNPIDFRLDVGYSRYDASTALLALSQQANPDVDINKARVGVWSGTLDLEFHVPLGTGVKGYLMGGGGAYQSRLSVSQPALVGGGYYGGYCNPFGGYCGGVYGIGEQEVAATTVTKFGWNAGAGLDFALPYGGSWFLEASFTRVRTVNGATPLQFVPIEIGLRF